MKSDGTVVAWGLNGSGQATVPAGLSQVVAIAGGGDHSLALKSDGTVVAWGLNNFGQATVPAGLSQVVAIAGGLDLSLTLKSDGTVVAWGYNGFGQATVPVGLSNVVAIAGGRDHSLALPQQDHSLFAWGGMGQEAQVNTSLPVPFKVQVRNAALQPVAGAVVRFQAGGLGLQAGGSFAGGLTEVLAVSDAQGFASSPAFNVSDLGGTFPVLARLPGIDDPALFLHTVRDNFALLQPNPLQAGTTQLVVAGTAGNDVITISPLGTSKTKVTVKINGVKRGNFAPTGRIVLQGLNGDDTLTVSGMVAKKAWLYGGKGDDILTGGKGADLLLGGAGDDDLNGGAGRDLLIGGLNSDDLLGGTGDDILIGGVTSHDIDLTALAAIMAEWTRTNADYTTRVDHLRGTLAGGLNLGDLLTESGHPTVLDDADAPDTLTGQGNLDWFWSDFFMDTFADQSAGEAINTIAG